MEANFLENNINLKDLYLKTEDYYTCINQDVNIFKRKIFHTLNEEYTEMEERKYLEFIKIFNSDVKLKQKIRKYNLSIFSNIIEKKPEVMRLLNLFNYEPDSAIKNLEKFVECLKKLKINNTRSNFNSSENNCYENKIFEQLGIDDKLRPIIGVNLSNISKYNINNSDLIQYCNKIISNLLFPGIVEQIILLINLENLSQSDFIANYSAMLIIMQINFASRIHKIYLKLTNANAKESFININRFIFKDVKDRIISYEENNVSQVVYELDAKILINYFNNNNSPNLRKSSKPTEKVQESVHNIILKKVDEPSPIKWNKNSNFIDFPNDISLTHDMRSMEDEEYFRKMKTADTATNNNNNNFVKKSLNLNIIISERFELSICKENNQLSKSQQIDENNNNMFYNNKFKSTPLEIVKQEAQLFSLQNKINNNIYKQENKICCSDECKNINHINFNNNNNEVIKPVKNSKSNFSEKKLYINEHTNNINHINNYITNTQNEVRRKVPPLKEYIIVMDNSVKNDTCCNFGGCILF